MGPAIFIIAILGCGEGESQCTQVRTLDTSYESQAACTAATEDAVARNSDVEYPVVVAQCVRSGSQARVRASDVRLPDGGRVEASASPVRS